MHQAPVIMAAKREFFRWEKKRGKKKTHAPQNLQNLKIKILSYPLCTPYKQEPLGTFGRTGSCIFNLVSYSYFSRSRSETLSSYKLLRTTRWPIPSVQYHFVRLFMRKLGLLIWRLMEFYDIGIYHRISSGSGMALCNFRKKNGE